MKTSSIQEVMQQNDQIQMHYYTTLEKLIEFMWGTSIKEL